MTLPSISHLIQDFKYDNKSWLSEEYVQRCVGYFIFKTYLFVLGQMQYFCIYWTMLVCMYPV